MQSGHSSFTLAVKSGLSWVSYRAVLVSGSRRAILPPAPAAAVVSVLLLLLLSLPHAATPSASAPMATAAMIARPLDLRFTCPPLGFSGPMGPSKSPGRTTAALTLRPHYATIATMSRRKAVTWGDPEA